MKRTFGKNICLFILIVLFTLCMAVGCTTAFNANTVADTQPSENNASSIILNLNRPALMPEDNIELTATVKMKNTDSNATDKWGSADFFIKSESSDHLELVDWEVNGDFANDSKYTSNLIINNSTDADELEQGFLHFYLAGKNEANCVPVTQDLIVKITLKMKSVDDGAPTSGNLSFSINNTSYNEIATWGSNGSNKGHIYNASSDLTIDASAATAEIRNPSADKTFSSVEVIEGNINGNTEGTTETPADKFVSNKPVKQGDTVVKTFTHTTARETKNTFYVKAIPNQKNALVQVKVGSTIYPELADEEDTYKVTLNGDGNNGLTEIKLIVTSEDGSSDDYTLNVTQTYAGLGGLGIKTNESDYGTTVDPEKTGLSKDTPIKEGVTTFEIFVPMAKNAEGALINGSATEVEITPSIITGYGMSTNIKLSANNCSIMTGTTAVNSGSSFKVNNIGDNATITVTLSNSAGAESAFTIKLSPVSIDTSIDSFKLKGFKDSSEITAVNPPTTGIDYTFKLSKESGYKATLSKNEIQLKDKATFKLLQSGTEVASTEGVYTLTAGRYKLQVIASAGNTEEYDIDVANEVLPGAIVSLEYSIDNGAHWVKVFNKVDGVQTGADFEYDSKKNTFTLNTFDTTTYVKFRIAITDSSSLSGFVGNGSEITSTENGKYLDYNTYEYSSEKLKNGVNNIPVLVSSENGTSNAYSLNIVITEEFYNITDIDFGNKNEAGDKHFNFDADTLTYDFAVPYKTSELNLTVFAKGKSTIVYVGGTNELYRQVIADDNNEEKAKGDSKHIGTVRLSSNTKTKIVITSKGTDGIKFDEDTDKKYTITIERKAASNDNTLKSLNVYVNGDESKDILVDEAFSSTKTDYTVKLAEGVELSKVKIVAVTNSDVAEINGNLGGATMEYTIVPKVKNEHTFVVKVIPENSMNGSGYKEYKITIITQEATLSDDAVIRDLRITGTDGKNYLADYDNGVAEYNINVPYSVSAVDVYAVHHENATFEITYNGKPSNEIEYDSNGFIVLKEGNDNEITVKVTSQDGNESSSYTIAINREKANTNANLLTLRVDNKHGSNQIKGQIDFASQYLFEVAINNSSDSDVLTFQIAAVNPNAKITLTENGKELTLTKIQNNLTYQVTNLGYGQSKTYTITVTSDDTVKIYVVKLTRDLLSPTLKTLEVVIDGNKTLPLYDKDGNLLDGLKNNIFKYIVKFPYNTANIEINGTTPDGMTSDIGLNKTIAELFANGNDPVDYFFTVSNGGIIQDYTITLVREASANSNTDVTELIFGKIPAMVFDNTKDYQGSYIVDNTKSTLNPIIKLAAENASYVIKVNGNVVKTTADSNLFELPVGKNTIEIVITASDTISKRTISLEVERKHADIKGIGFADGDSGSSIDAGIQFDNDVNSYSFNVANGVKILNVDLKLADGYTYTVSGNTLEEGKMNKVTVQVKDANNNVVKTLELNVYRNVADADYTMWYIIAGVLGGLAIILLIIAIIAFVKGGRGGSRRKGNINDIGIGDYELD